jgi:hypothetical protein
LAAVDLSTGLIDFDAVPGDFSALESDDETSSHFIDAAALHGFQHRIFEGERFAHFIHPRFIIILSISSRIVENQARSMATPGCII